MLKKLINLNNLLPVLLFLLIPLNAFPQHPDIDQYNVVWDSQSRNSSESMPCGGGDIGLNAWVENGDLFFYISRSGTFDENNAFLKLGRGRLKLSPNPFSGMYFRQELVLKDGNVVIKGADNGIETEVKIWVDVFKPVVHVAVRSNSPIEAESSFESWRYKDRPSLGKANNANSYKWAPQGEVKTWKDEIAFVDKKVLFYHRNNNDRLVFDVAVKQQGLDSVKHLMFNPLRDLTFGGMMEGVNMVPAGTYSGTYVNTDFSGWKLKSVKPSKTHKVNFYLHTAQAKVVEEWQKGLQKTADEARKSEKEDFAKTTRWWSEYWKRSFIAIGENSQSAGWEIGKNYQLFRYMLGCNAYANYPTKFNGGLFTVDPVFTDTTLKFTPDHRNWGGGTMTAQNQRLVYFPMFKNGDFDMLKPQFDFYLQMLKNAELRSQVYWRHEGACFTEQIENFGLPNPAEYGWKRPDGYDKGVEYNAWLEYQWDTVLEFCLMMLDVEQYTGRSIAEYVPFIESCLTFFNEHYLYLAKLRGRKPLDGDGHLVLYPGSACETYKMAYNSTSTIAALKTVLTRLLALPPQYLSDEKRKAWSDVLKTIPPINYSEFSGHKTIAPAKLWERINNSESPQLYPVYPWGIYGVGKPDLEIAVNTWKYDTNVGKFRSHVGWKQDNIFAARLGLTKEALELTTLKLKDSDRRFPAFWGPGFDWVPDHNWGGSGMIGLQEMLLQTDGKILYLFPAWPKEWDVRFKLHAPYNTVVEGELRSGKVISITVSPDSRKKDIVNLLK
jgi:hypothetical protein